MVIAIALAVTACADDQSDVAPPVTAPAPTSAPTTTLIPDKEYDIVGTALQATVFTELAGLLVKADLVETLRGGPFTVFAPTNDAFAKLPDAVLDAVHADPELLATVLTYHVVAGELSLADLQEGELMTVAGVPLEITRNGDTVSVNGYEIVAGDVAATNGVIHVMDQVLVPPS